MFWWREKRTTEISRKGSFLHLVLNRGIRDALSSGNQITYYKRVRIGNDWLSAGMESNGWVRRAKAVLSWWWWPNPALQLTQNNILPRQHSGTLRNSESWHFLDYSYYSSQTQSTEFRRFLTTSDGVQLSSLGSYVSTVSAEHPYLCAIRVRRTFFQLHPQKSLRRNADGCLWDKQPIKMDILAKAYVLPP